MADIAWKTAAQVLAADNARLCEIALAADALAEAVSAYLAGNYVTRPARRNTMYDVLDAYKTVRQGQ